MSGIGTFDRIAPWYDSLKGLVFGTSIRKSEHHHVSSLPKGGNFLLIGGGSGELITALLEHSPDVKLYFVEASLKMLELARRRVYLQDTARVFFIHGTERDIPSAVEFDCVITSFFLDLFDEKDLMTFRSQILGQLKDNGYWLATDFVNDGKWWQRFLLRLMYSFFRMAANLQTQFLPHWRRAMDGEGLELAASASYYRGFIVTSLYRKAGR